MSLNVGGRLGSYEIIALLGAGGMGEVYRAKDTKLGRDVALKILPASFTNDPERVARFRREAQVLASLNHAHIGQIYGLEEATRSQFLVLELVDGQSLDKRIGQGQIPVDEALGIAKQIAEALEAAHEKGIIHRDLKPANIALTTDGQVKVLDFGLAKAVEATSGAALDAMNSPTITSPAVMTGVGVILGTAAYMSPEQAKGRTADKRSDIWAFGCVLYEMLTGKRAFEGDDVSDTVACVITKEPGWNSLPSNTPAEIRRLLRRCLQKDRSRRLADIGDARLEIDEALSIPPIEPTSARVTSNLIDRWKVVVAVAVLVLGSVAAGFWMWPKSAPLHPLRQLTFGAGVARTPALSPDGKLLAYATDRDRAGQFEIWLKQMAGGDAIRLTGGSGSKTNPEFSNDGTKVYYLSAGSIFEVPTLGGPARRVIEQAGPFSISRRGEIGYYRPTTGGLSGPMFVVPAGGGAPEAWQPECRSSTPPVWSPDGDRSIFAGVCRVRDDVLSFRPSLKLASRRGGTWNEIGDWDLASPDAHLVWFRLQNGSEGVVVPARTGDSVNLYRMSLDGKKVPVTHGTGVENWPVVSSSGELIFVRAEQTPIIWSLRLQDDNGTPTQEAAPGQMFGTSRDGGMLIYGRMVGSEKGQLIFRVRQNGNESVLAEHEVSLTGAGSFWPQISPDGKQVIYRAYANPPGHYKVSTDGGTPRFLVAINEFGLASDWSPDGKRVIGECTPTSNGICELDPDTGKTRGLLKDPQGGELLYPSYSWDGKWVAFMRRRTGRTVIWVTPVHSDGTLAGEMDWVQISSEDANAARPRFSSDGSAIYYELIREDIRVLAKQTFDPIRGRPRGEPVQVATVRSPLSNPFVVNLLTVTRDRVFFNTVETHSNVWMTQIE